ALIHERAGAYPKAEAAVVRARRIAARLEDPMTKLAAGMRQRRLDRHQGRTSARGLLAYLDRFCAELDPQDLVQRPAIFREVAAELGGRQRKLLQLAADHFLEEILQQMSNTEIVDLVERLGLTNAEEAQQLRIAHSAELIKLTHHRIDEMLHAAPS